MFFRKTRDIIVETATIVKGLKADFKSHEDNEDDKIDGLYEFVDNKVQGVYQVIKDCHETCPESQRFADHTEAQNGTLLRIEKKYDDYQETATKRTKDLKESLDSVKDDVKSMKEAKKTARQTWADIGKIIASICIVGGLLFGIMKYNDDKKAVESKKIEILLEKLVDKIP